MNRERTNQLVITAMFIALTFIFTVFVNIRLPFGGNGGLIHLGNVPLFLAAILYGKRVGAIAGGVGMALFDLLSGWTAWAPFTLVIVATMGYSMGVIMENKKSHFHLWYICAVAVALFIKVIGYYLAELILYGDPIVPLSSIPGNIIQVSIAALVVLAAVTPLQKALAHLNIRNV